MKRKGEGSCLLKQGKPRLELPRWSISISEWSCSCTATTTLQGGTSEEGTLWMCSEAGETLIFQPVWKIRRQVDAREANKNKRGGEKGKRARKKFEILKRTEFYKLFEVEILNNSLEVTSGSETLWGNTTHFSIFFPLVLSIKVCHNPGYRQCKCSFFIFFSWK